MSVQRQLGPTATKLLDGHCWSDADHYPASEPWTNEVDDLLQFALRLNVIDRFLPNIKAKERHRDKTLSELRAAFVFHQHGFLVSDWDPQGENGTKGEFRIQRPRECSIFVEVKSPGWESQIANEEIRKIRSKQPKYLPDVMEGGAIDTWGQLRDCIKRNAYKEIHCY